MGHIKKGYIINKKWINKKGVHNKQGVKLLYNKWSIS